MKETLAKANLEINSLENALGSQRHQIEKLEKSLRFERNRINSLKGSIACLHQVNSNLQGYIDRVREAEQPENRRHQERRRPSLQGVDSFMQNKEDEKPWWEI